MPTYRYVPGRHPHPSKHPKGHYNETPPVALEVSVSNWATQEGWKRGLDLFDHRFYWECHEQLEAIWHRLESNDPHRSFVQGLIQAAAYRLKWHMGHDKSARTLKLACEKRLEMAHLRLGEVVWDVNIPKLLLQIARVETENIWPELTDR